VRAPADSLSREAVIDVGVELARTQGLSAVTMRSVATELDVTPMALYYYVENKEQLVALITATVQAQTGPLSVGEDDWETTLRNFLISQWENLTKYPGLGAYMVRLPNLGTSPESYARGTEFFESAGFPPREAQLAWAFAATFIHGRLSVDANLDRASARSTGKAGIKAAEHLTFGVDAVIAGIKTMLAEVKARTA
jgi:TetR/AcrR family tetracycline transcriptional repressor